MGNILVFTNILGDSLHEEPVQTLKDSYFRETS